MKKILSILICFTLLMSTLTFAGANTNTTLQFGDVDPSTPQGQAIYKLVQSGILCGYGDGTFKPANSITRAELCKIINMAFNFTVADETNFKDVSKSDWFYSYAAVAKKAGYITGYEDGTFRGNNNLTRQEACTIISRVADLHDIPFTTPIADKVDDWALPYVNKVLGNRLMVLEAGNKFRATEKITRGELTHVVSVFVPEPSEKEEKPSTGSTGGSTGGGNGGGNGGGSVGGGTGGGSILPPRPGGNTGGGNTGTGTKPENPGTDPETPGTGTDPETPGTGTDPETPGTGTNPETPGTGTDPETPGTGTDPETPGTGTDPETPGTGTDPETPGTGTDPETPGTGADPETPGTGTDPETPGTGTDPETPGTGTDPETPGTGTDPETPGTGTEPEIPSKPEDPKPPVIDSEKQTAALSNINQIIAAIDRYGARFSKDEQAVLGIINGALKKTREDANKNIPIYDGNYVVTTYGDDIDNAKSLYKAMTETAKGNFEKNLMRYLPSYAADELCLMIFGKKVEDLVDENM